MDNAQYNLNRYNRKKQWYRIRLGIEQFLCYPILNFIWLLLCIGVIFLLIGERKLIAFLEFDSILEPVFVGCMKFLIIFFPVICAIGIMQFVGEITARKDEADLMLAFDKKDLRNGCPILMNKKKIKRTDVIMREFYSNIPLKIWSEKMDCIADSMNVHFVEPIQYGGNSNGKRIVLHTATGRKPVERGDLYDDEL